MPNFLPVQFKLSCSHSSSSNTRLNILRHNTVLKEHLWSCLVQLYTSWVCCKRVQWYGECVCARFTHVLCVYCKIYIPGHRGWDIHHCLSQKTSYREAQTHITVITHTHFIPICCYNVDVLGGGVECQVLWSVGVQYTAFQCHARQAVVLNTARHTPLQMV